VKKVRLHTSTQTAFHCLCWCCFYRKFSAAGGTDQLILRVTLRQTSRT
jgi:hypothetical protein